MRLAYGLLAVVLLRPFRIIEDHALGELDATKLERLARFPDGSTV
jgi:hypothetical protein